MGVTPSSLFWMAFSISLMLPGSKGLMTMSRASGMEMVARAFRGVGEP